MIRLEGITKSFGSLQVLRGHRPGDKKGEVVSIVGPSGAGKTTLLQIMGTLDMPDSGSVTIDGTLVNCLKEKELSAFRNKHIGFVFFSVPSVVTGIYGFGECNDTGFHCRNGTAGSQSGGCRNIGLHGIGGTRFAQAQ